MKKSDLVKRVSEATGFTQKDVKEVTDALFEVIVADVVEGEKVKINKFGTFYPADVSARTARNPRTGDPIEVPAKTVPKFKASSVFKQMFTE